MVLSARQSRFSRCAHRIMLSVLATAACCITGTAPGAQEHPLAPVCRADVGGADATPEPVIPRFGQVSEYTVETASMTDCGFSAVAALSR